MTQPDIRIILRSRQVGEENDRIVDHSEQPAPYVEADGAVWTWQDEQAWRRVGNADLRVYDPAASS